MPVLSPNQVRQVIRYQNAIKASHLLVETVKHISKCVIRGDRQAILAEHAVTPHLICCLLYTSPSPRD